MVVLAGYRRRPTRSLRLPICAIFSTAVARFLRRPTSSGNERQRAALEKEAFRAAGDARSFLAREAIAWARATPADTRAAEALARVVDGWRHACGSEDGSSIAREAFTVLHRQYPIARDATNALLAPVTAGIRSQESGIGIKAGQETGSRPDPSQPES
jgi:hypothetical protein